MNDVFILSGKRTPIGSFMGELSGVEAPKLAATAIKGAIEATTINKDEIDEVYMGSVLTAGVGQAPARQAAIFSGLKTSARATTINKVCGSGLQAIILGANSIKLGQNNLVVAGGMENMSLAPHLLPNSRSGYKYGNQSIVDSMQFDGLWDVYTNRTMGNCAEECLKTLKISRAEQDEFAIESFKRAQKSTTEKVFAREITPVKIVVKKDEKVVVADEGPFKANFEKIPKLNPAFEKEGTITAANASTINDGAAAVILSSSNASKGAKFKIRSYAGFAHEPTWFTTAPINSIQKALQLANLKLSDIDLFEINEAFAMVAIAAVKELKIPQNKLNIYGGAIALGHPIGCSGTRIVVTLMNAMENSNARLGLASICIGGGEALSLIIERIN
ncbi:MAG: thiolase family protein [Bacteriovoracaceae bacterium]